METAWGLTISARCGFLYRRPASAQPGCESAPAPGPVCVIDNLQVDLVREGAEYNRNNQLNISNFKLLLGSKCFRVQRSARTRLASQGAHMRAERPTACTTVDGRRQGLTVDS